MFSNVLESKNRNNDSLQKIASKFEGGSLVMQYQFFPNKAVRGFVPNFSSNLFS
jgi:hypothetical protein